MLWVARGFTRSSSQHEDLGLDQDILFTENTFNGSPGYRFQYVPRPLAIVKKLTFP